MSLIPKSLEPLGFTPVEEVDDIEVGDLVVVPSMKDAPKLRVSIATLRKWGMGIVTSGNRYGLNKYRAVCRVFASKGWYDSEPDCLDSHAFRVSEISRNNNARFESRVREPIISYENVNSVAKSVEVVKKQKAPIMNMTLEPVFPYPRVLANENNGYPTSISFRENREAYDLLRKAIGDRSMPVSRELRYERDAFKPKESVGDNADLTFTMALLNYVFSVGNSTSADIFSDEKIAGIPSTYTYDRADPESRAFIMAAPADGETHDDNAKRYFSRNSGEAHELELDINRKFLDNVWSRGVRAFHAPGANTAMSRIMASMVAADMEERYRKALKKAKNAIAGLTGELSVLEEIIGRYHEAAAALMPDKNICKGLEELL